MIERDFILPDGRNIKYHSYSESIVDIAAKNIKYISRSKELPDAVDFVLICVEVDFIAWAPELLNNPEQHFINGDLKQYGISEAKIKSFDELKLDKSNELAAACRLEITSGFPSSALGAEHLYPSNTTDQINLSGTIQRSLLSSATASESYLFLCADESNFWEYRPHTAAQIQQVGVDAYAFILNARVKNSTLQAQVESATNPAELALVNW